MEKTIKEIDYQRLDKLLEILYQEKSKVFTKISSIYNPLFKNESDHRETDWLSYFEELKLLELVTSLSERTNDAVKISKLGIEVYQRGGAQLSSNCKTTRATRIIVENKGGKRH